jgi:2-iminobutanoate/2-iminopropanoate deaminase
LLPTKGWAAITNSFEKGYKLSFGERMTVIKHNPENVYPQYQSYSHAIEISSGSRLLIISGLNGYLPDGQSMPDTFEEQGEIIWQYLGTILASAQMSYQNLVSIRTYLAGPEFDEANVRLRRKYLGDHEPASTVVCCQLLDRSWKLEMEAMAAA